MFLRPEKDAAEYSVHPEDSGEGAEHLESLSYLEKLKAFFSFRKSVGSEELPSKVSRDHADSEGVLTKLEDRPPLMGFSIIVLVGGLLITFILWAYLTEVDEVARGQGKVIPSSKVQLIQSSEPGVVSEILVKSGQRVDEGTILIRLDDTSTSANLGEQEARERMLTAQIERLRMEWLGTQDSYVCSEKLMRVAPVICENEVSLMHAREKNLELRKRVLEERAEQRQRELNEARSNQRRINEQLVLAQRELELIEPLAERKVVAETDFIQAKRSVSDLQGQKRAIIESIARIEAGLREAKFQIDEQTEIFRQEALAEMNKNISELSVVMESIRGAADRVDRTDIRSPVKGIINKIEINTIGAFVNAGQRIMDIVPLDDKLLIEAKVRPSDIAFLRPGQPANIKITAYDFSIFGGLDGHVSRISADSMYDEQTRDTYYTVVIESEKNVLEHNSKSYPIFPGMVSQVDILTGRKSILHYLLKPINKARREALRER